MPINDLVNVPDAIRQAVKPESKSVYQTSGFASHVTLR
jgi:hypothetical protein